MAMSKKQSKMLSFLKHKKAPDKTIVGFTSDGANVMAGVLTGVGMRLEKKAGKKLLKMKYCAHQLELGV